MGQKACLWAGLAGLHASSVAAANPWVQQEFAVLANSTYMFNLMVGTPPQPVSVDLDFGSADIRILAGSNPCVAGCDPTAHYLAFNSSASLTFATNHSFSATSRLSDGSFVTNAWGWDSVQIGGASLEQMVVAIGPELENPEPQTPIRPDPPLLRNLLGLGPRGLEACVMALDNFGHPTPTYENLLTRLHKNGMINAASFSVWVDPTTKTHGKLLLGAVDESLYRGKLETVPIALVEPYAAGIEEPLYLSVSVNELSLQLGGLPDAVPVLLEVFAGVAILNSRANFSMPQPLLASLGKALGGVWSSRLAAYIVPCSASGAIQLQLDTTTLRIPLEDFLTPLVGVSYATDPREVCSLDIELAREIYLSNKVLQNFFVAVDYDLGEISFASPAEPAGSNIEPMASTQSLFEAEPSFVVLRTIRTPFSVEAPSFSASVSSYYLLGGAIDPTPYTGTAYTAMPAKVSVASNGARISGNCMSAILMYLLALV